MGLLMTKEYTDERGREYYLDNAKFILIVLVVLAHLTSPLKTNMHLLKTAWIIINAFHMPCFILISGYLAKSYVRKDGTVKRQRLFTYVVYYLAAQIAVSLFEYFVLGEVEMTKSLLSPRSSLWYLMCLCIWHLILPYIAKVRPAIVLSVAVFCALLAGYDTALNNVLSLLRVINHFPFFLVGYYFKPEWLYKFRKWWTQVLAALVLVGATVWIYFNLDKVASRVITSNYNYKNSNLIYFSEHFQWLNRALYYVVALVLCAAFLLLVPRCKMFFTKFGARTLQVYILHRFLYLAELQYEWYVPFISRPGATLVGVFAIVITFILSLKPFEYPFKLLGKIQLSWFEKQEEQKQ